MVPFKKNVIAIVQKIPPGKVASYGQIAAYAGLPRSARHVGRILQEIDNTVVFPWWRVINNAGFISIRGTWTADKFLQRKLLESEGVIVSDDFRVQMQRFRFELEQKELQSLGLSTDTIQLLHDKYFRL